MVIAAESNGMSTKLISPALTWIWETTTVPARYWKRWPPRAMRNSRPSQGSVRAHWLRANPFATDLLPAGSRIACRIEYDGSRYSGWQAQPQRSINTVQTTLERGSPPLRPPLSGVHCAGRTDTGRARFCADHPFRGAGCAQCQSLGAGCQCQPAARCPGALGGRGPAGPDFHARFSRSRDAIAT